MKKVLLAALAILVCSLSAFGQGDRIRKYQILEYEENYYQMIYNPQIQIFAESETKRPFFKCSFKTKRTKKGLAHNTNNKARNKSQNHSISGLALSSTIQQAI